MEFHRTRPMRLLRHLVREREIVGVRGAVAHIYQRFCAALGRHGVAGTLKRTVHEAASASQTLEPERPDPFDALHGTDTGGFVCSSASVPGFLSSAYANSYHGIAPSALTQALAQLPIQPEKFTFVDLGCGKGRALMVAAQFPFLRLLGVEIAPSLCRIAETNIARTPDWAARISILNRDATTVTLPNTPLVIFLYNPFLPSLLRQVLANLERQLRQRPRESYLLYAENPRYTRVLNRFPFLRELSEVEYPFSQEDCAARPDGATHERVTLYSADLPR
jgi:SAM-dependent methyltransferase